MRTNDVDPFDLQRFVEAQAGGVHERALAELRGGRKLTHWMWFVFPQLAGLGYSPMATRYGLSGLDEARAYLMHPTLGPRLLECCAALEALGPRLTAHDVLGSPDDVKLRSSLTLFARVSTADAAFDRLLTRYFGGQPDERTIAMLQRQAKR